MTPIRRGTAQRLGLRRPKPPVGAFTVAQFEAACRELGRALRQAAIRRHQGEAP